MTAEIQSITMFESAYHCSICMKEKTLLVKQSWAERSTQSAVASRHQRRAVSRSALPAARVVAAPAGDAGADVATTTADAAARDLAEPGEVCRDDTSTA